MQLANRRRGRLLVKEWKGGHGLVTEYVRRQHGLTRRSCFLFVIGIDSEQRLSRLHPISDLVMDHKTYGMIDGIGFFGASSSKRHRRLAHVTRIDL